MKIIGINCSPRQGRSTFKALSECMRGVQETASDIEVKIIELAGKQIHGCTACDYCKSNFGCSIEDDFQQLLPELSSEDLSGIVIGTPVYMGNMAAQCKAFIDRSVIFRRNGFRFKNLVGGVIAVGGVRNGGQELTIQTVQSALLIHDMLVVSEGRNTAHFGGTVWSQGDVGDEFGLTTARNLGKRVSETVMMLDNSTRSQP